MCFKKKNPKSIYENIVFCGLVHCNECIIHGNCLLEDMFNYGKVENPFCCAGKLKKGDKND